MMIIPYMVGDSLALTGILLTGTLLLTMTLTYLSNLQHREICKAMLLLAKQDCSP